MQKLILNYTRLHEHTHLIHSCPFNSNYSCVRTRIYIEVLRLVRTRIQRWVDGDLAALWSEAVAGAQSLSKRSLSTSQHSSNIRRAKLAVQDGQFSKAIKVLAALTRLVNFLASGRAPSDITPHLCGATLLASKKKKGGLRPIAVGEVLRRLVSKCLATLAHCQALAHLSPLQLGVSVRGGCEAIVHATSHLMSSLQGDERWTLLLDFTNAFNSISRQAMFVEFRRHLPGLSAWMESCYSCQPLLHLGQDIIHSCCGVQQGDPLGPLGFALTLHPIIERIRAEVPSLALNAWYLDDGTLVGPPGDLSAALHIVESEGPSVGLHLNREKSLLFIPSDCDASSSSLPPEVLVVRGGFCLGCPIGPSSFCEEVLQDRVGRIRESLGVLRDMHDSHLETSLLCSCLALPKLSYILRTCPPSSIINAAAGFDAAIREALESILGGPLTEWSWIKASLPCSRGGINLRSASIHAPAAFLVSCVSLSGAG